MQFILFIVALGLLATVTAVFLKESRLPVMAFFVTLAAGVIIFVKVIPSLGEIFITLRDLTSNAGLNLDYLALILKVVCIAYMGEFAAQLCRDADEGGIAKKIELGVKVIIMLMALPLLETILSSVIDILS